MEKSKNSINVEGGILFCGEWIFLKSVSMGPTFIREMRVLYWQNNGLSRHYVLWPEFQHFLLFLIKNLFTFFGHLEIGKFDQNPHQNHFHSHCLESFWLHWQSRKHLLWFVLPCPESCHRNWEFGQFECRDCTSIQKVFWWRLPNSCNN